MKKIIAREFLIVLGGIISFFPLLITWNFIQENIRREINLVYREIYNTPRTNLEKMQELYETTFDLRSSFFMSFSTEGKILNISIFIFSILFLMRYLFYAVKWSIIQLKEK